MLELLLVLYLRVVPSLIGRGGSRERPFGARVKSWPPGCRVCICLALAPFANEEAKSHRKYQVQALVKNNYNLLLD